MSSLSVSSAQPSVSSRSWKSIALVFCCTLIQAAAQMLIKTGANHIQHRSLFDTLIGILTTLPLFAGYSMYGVSMILLVLALRDGELSQLYPVISLTYVWVCFLSVFVLHEPVNVFKVAGILLIVFGVAVLGKGGKA
ncbi:MAG TPA: EamA family transporter [Bryobacteraceae bacterium]|nr:EamA family transporter [Bryobacteraceae bacterium]